MRRWFLILLLFVCPWVAHANPVMIDSQSLIAFGIVAFWALVVESGIATLVVVGSGVVILPLFMLLAVVNLAIFLFAFLPLTDGVSLWLLEPGVILVDASVIKLLTSVPFLEGAGVTWLKALLASLLGNVASFFVGVIGSGAPWNALVTG